MQENTTTLAVKKVNPRSFMNNNYAQIGDAVNMLSRCIDYYKKICESCKQILASDHTSEEKDERIRYVFRWDARTFRDYVKDCKKAISEVKEFVEPDVE